MTVDAARLAATLSASLPALDVERLAGTCLAGRQAVLALRAEVGTAALRRACTALLDGHNLTSVGTALHAVGLVRAEPKDCIEVVWTGPESGTGGRRLTASVVTDLIASARRELLLIGFAVQDEPHVVAALKAAVARGVVITVLLESRDDNPGSQANGAPLVRWTAPALPGPVSSGPTAPHYTRRSWSSTTTRL